MSRPAGVDDGPGRALAKLQTAPRQFTLESLAIGGRIPGCQAGRADAGELDAGPALDETFFRRHRRDRLVRVDETVLGHPRDDVVAPFLSKAVGD